MDEYIDVWPKPENQLIEVIRKSDNNVIARHMVYTDTITAYDTYVSKYLNDNVIAYPDVNKRESNMVLSNDACYERRKIIVATNRNKYGMYDTDEYIIKWSKVQ